ncbi:hypothetical protein, partial [Ectopseudomonas guguanensis]|uniref:hypothetical protein n=1 Tax=Ectopseudomonas guguanensis TaxID=1198456 RepID=UPI003CFE5824
DLSTIAEDEISNPPWVNFQSAGWVSFRSAPTFLIARLLPQLRKYWPVSWGCAWMKSAAVT